jgi:hypothetical protein
VAGELHGVQSSDKSHGKQQNRARCLGGGCRIVSVPVSTRYSWKIYQNVIQSRDVEKV